MGSTWINGKNQLDRLTDCSAHLTRHKNVSFLDRIVTCYEKWVSYVNCKRSSRWLDKNEAPKHCPKAPLHSCKTLLTVLWGVMELSNIFCYQSINCNSWIILRIYIKEIHEKLKIQRPALVNRQEPILLPDNARPHTSRLTVMTPNELGFEILQHLL